MTREEAKRILYVYRAVNLVDASHREAFDKAIKALEQEPCEDCISKEKVIDILDYWYDSDSDGYIQAAKSINELPSVQPKTGHWIYDKTLQNWRCSKCDETPKTMGYVGTADFMAEHFKFCNHCGAKMVEPQERSDKE